MKLTLDLTDSSQLRRSLQTHIESEFNHLERYTGGVRSDLSEPLASCLQEYYEQVHDNHALEDPVLTLLLARSLWHLGEEDLAMEYLDHAQSASVSINHQALLKVRVPITPAIAHLVFLRVLRSGSFLSAESTNQWLLDLSRLDDTDHAVFELTRHMLLRRLLEGIGPVFDPQDGQGSLFIQRFTRRSQHRTQWGLIRGWPAAELLGWSRTILMRIQEERGWTSLPRLYVMEFSA